MPEGTEEISNDEAEKWQDTSSDNAEDAGANETDSADTNTPEETENSTEGASEGAELTDEQIGELVYQAKEILEVPEGANLSDDRVKNWRYDFFKETANYFRQNQQIYWWVRKYRRRNTTSVEKPHTKIIWYNKGRLKKK